MESKIQYKSTYLQNKNGLPAIENRLWFPRGRIGRGGKGWEFGRQTIVNRMDKQQGLTI